MIEGISAELLLQAYAYGLFPMADGRHDHRIKWINPAMRGIIPLDEFNIPRKFRKVVESGYFEITVDKCFRDVITACADMVSGKRKSTWINDEIIETYCELHRMGNAHSVESWRGGKLVGGLYGVSIGAAFFGESMFATESEASKVALVHLVARLKQQGFQLLDTQFVNDHLKQFGVIEIFRDDYMQMLAEALKMKVSF